MPCVRLRFAADLAVGTVVLAAVPVAAVGRRVHEVASPAISLVREDLARQVGAALDRLVPVAVTRWSSGSTSTSWSRSTSTSSA